MDSRFARPVAGTFVAYLAGLAANLVVSILVARTMGPGGAGVIALALVGPNILALLGNLGLPNAISHFLRRRSMHPGRVVVAGLPLAVVSGFVLIVAYAVAVPWIHQWLTAPSDVVAASPYKLSPTLIEMAAAVIVLEIMLQCLMAVYQGLERFGSRSVILLAYRWLYAALAAGAIALFGAEPWLVVAAGIAAYFVTCMVGLLASLWTVMSTPLEETSGSLRTDARQLLAYAWRTHVSAVLVFVILRSDLFLVQALLGDAAEVGLYSRAVQVAEVILYFMLAVENVLFPRMSGLIPSDAPRAAATLCRRALLAGAALVVVFELASRWLILIPFGAEFAGSIAPLRVLLPGVLAIGLARAVFAVFNALERPWVPAAISAGGLAVILSLDLAWIPRYGIGGAALASLVTYVAMAAAALVWFTRSTGQPLSAFLVPRRSDLAALCDVRTRHHARSGAPPADE